MRTRRFCVIALAMATAGCGNEVTTTSTSSATTDTSTSDATSSSTGGTGVGGMTSVASSSTGIGEPSDVYPAPHPAGPKVENYGGPVLKNPKFVPIFFSNDDAPTTAALEDFTNKIGGTPYWTAATSEYGVGAGVALPAIHLMEAAPTTISDDAIQTWLADKITNDPTEFPPNDANTLYVIYYPSTTSIDLQGSTSCQEFGGYHSDLPFNGGHAAYAVVPRCDAFAGMSTLDSATSAGSHELIEAATDPYPMEIPAYTLMDDAHIFWLRVLGGGETGDMCAQFEDSYVNFPELPEYVVQRSWSNKAEKAGHDPCQAVLDASVPYYNAVPVDKDKIAYSLFGQVIMIPGTLINAGETKTIDLDLYSDADTGGPFSVEASDLSSLFGGTPKLDLSLDESEGQNGQVLHLTIKVLAAGKNKTETYVLMSQLPGGARHMYLGIVGSPM
jgi:hypothetical protein